MHGKHHFQGRRPWWAEEERGEEHSAETGHKEAWHGHHGEGHGHPHGWHGGNRMWGGPPQGGPFRRPFGGPGFGRPFGPFRGFGPRGPWGFAPRGPRGGGPFGGPRGPFGGGPFGGGPFGGGPFGDDPGDRGGGRRRQRRGDIKFALLELLAEQPRHGYDLIKELEQRYAGFYRPSPGSVYPTLQLLEDDGSIVGEQVEGKRIYTITAEGRKALEERQKTEPEGMRGPGGPSPELAALRESAMALQSSIMQAARHGTAEQRAAVLKRLDAARREIYGILAQGEDDQTV